MACGNRIRNLAAGLVALTLAVSADAAPKLVASAPAANSVATKPTAIRISLSEPASGGDIKLTMTGMPGMANHAPMKVAGFKTVIGEDGKSLMAQLPRALPVGSYLVEWSTVGGAGSFPFTVR